MKKCPDCMQKTMVKLEGEDFYICSNCGCEE